MTAHSPSKASGLPAGKASEDGLTARFALRAATAEAHARLDAMFSRFDLADPAGYADFLRAQAGAFLAVETALDGAGAVDFVPDWKARRRSGALLGDLAALGVTPPAQPTPPDFPTEAAVLGGLYVLEGSRLGGAMLVRTVPDGLPRSFLSPGNPAAWRAFVALLDARLSSDIQVQEAAASAGAVFAIFEMSARDVLGVETT